MSELLARLPLIVLGCGSWGTALALYGATRFEQLKLWGPFADEINMLNQDRENKKYIPGVKFPKHLVCTASLDEALEADSLVLICVPSHVFVETITHLKPFTSKIKTLIIATKGVTENGLFLHELAEEILGVPVAVLSGPSFAKEVAMKMPTSVSLASKSADVLTHLTPLLHSAFFRIYPSTDVRGVAIGGVVKNVIAIAVGISDGLGFGANARAALITKGLQEMSLLSRAVGGQLETIMSLAGLGDMVLTTTDNQSRNRRFGLALGQGQAVDAAEQAIGQVVEGKRSVKELLLMAKQYKVELPICEQMEQVIYGAKPAQNAMLDLLNLPIQHT